MADVSEEYDFPADSNLWASKATKSIVFCLSFTQSRPFSRSCIPSAMALGQTLKFFLQGAHSLLGKLDAGFVEGRHALDVGMLAFPGHG